MPQMWRYHFCIYIPRSFYRNQMSGSLVLTWGNHGAIALSG